MDSGALDYLFLYNLLSELSGELAEGCGMPDSIDQLSQLSHHISPSSGKSMSAIWLSYFPQISEEFKDCVVHDAATSRDIHQPQDCIIPGELASVGTVSSRSLPSYIFVSHGFLGCRIYQSLSDHRRFPFTADKRTFTGGMWLSFEYVKGFKNPRGFLLISRGL
jgi:hypothetical protein